MKRYFWNLFIAYDQFCNAICGGDPDETISSRMGKWACHQEKGIKYYIGSGICFILNFIDKDHCSKSVEKDEGKEDLLD